MSDLRPKGLPITLLDGKERDILFTLAVVDEVQDHYDQAVAKVMARITDPRETYPVMAFLLTALINDSIRRAGNNEDPIKLEDVKELVDVPLAARLIRPVMTSYGYSLPESDEEEDPNPRTSRSS